MATERGNLFVADWKARNQFKQDSKRQATNDFQSSIAGAGTTPLSEFQNTENTRYAMDNVGWNKAQELRQKAEAADVGATPPPGGQYDRRYNYATDEMEWIEKDPSNFWKANKRELIGMGGALLGMLVGAPGLGYGLATSARDIYKSRDDRRDLRSDRRQWNYDQALQAQAEEDARRANTGNLFRSGGEGVVEYATKDLSKKKKDQYVRANV